MQSWLSARGANNDVWERTMGSIMAGLEYLVVSFSVGPVLLALIMFLFLSKGAAKRGKVLFPRFSSKR